MTTEVTWIGTLGQDINVRDIEYLIIYRSGGEFTHAYVYMLDGIKYGSTDKQYVFGLSEKAGSMGIVTDLETLAVKYVYSNFVIGEEEE